MIPTPYEDLLCRVLTSGTLKSDRTGARAGAGSIKLRSSCGEYLSEKALVWGWNRQNRLLKSRWETSSTSCKSMWLL